MSESPTAPCLRVSTGSTTIDSILAEFIGACAHRFPQRSRSYLLIGSHSDGSGVEDSDIDLVVIFRQRSTAEEQAHFARLLDAYNRAAPLRIDGHILDEDDLAAGVTAAIKQALVVAGDELPPDLPLEPTRRKLWRSMAGAFHYAWILRGKAPDLVYPLQYPNRDGEFFGYEQWGGFLGGSIFVPGLRIIVNEVTLMLTTRVAQVAGYHVATKSDSIAAYRHYIGDEWSAYVEELYATLKGQWGYRLPTTHAQRALLRSLCEPLLAFENHFLSLCYPLIQEAMTGADVDARQGAARCLSRIRFA
jgi:predicted nucleotidyltransferase